MPVLTRNNIAACQIHKRHPEYFFIPEFDSGLVVFRSSARPTVRRSLKKILSACASSTFIVCLPENSIPISDVDFLRDQAAKLDLTIIGGLEHRVTWLRRNTTNPDDYHNAAYVAENRFVVLRPDGRDPEYGKKNFPAKVKGHSVTEQIERNPDPEFPFFSVPTPDGSEMNVWPILCSDFLEIASERFREELDRKIRADKIDLIAVLSHTHRADAFHSTIKQLITGDTRRPLPTNILFTNFALYGGSFCLAYNERGLLRGSGNYDFWKTRVIRAGEESFGIFVDWPAALQAVRTERTLRPHEAIY